MYACARDGCSKPARGDEYCSAACCRIDHGLENETDRRGERNRQRRVANLRKKHGDYIEVENPEMTVHAVRGNSHDRRSIGLDIPFGEMTRTGRRS